MNASVKGKQAKVLTVPLASMDGLVGRVLDVVDANYDPTPLYALAAPDGTTVWLPGGCLEWQH